MGSFQDRGAKLLQHLGEAGVLLVEWEMTLLIRLGIPLVENGSLFFLVPDKEMQTVHDIAADLDLFPADDTVMRPSYPCEFSGVAVRYLVDDSTLLSGPPRRRLVFLPLSWSGVHLSELRPIAKQTVPNTIDSGSSTQATFEPRTPRTVPMPPVPDYVQTVSIAGTCAALIRIAAHSPGQGPLRRGLELDLSSIVAYSLFDMSYEGAYMELKTNDEPLSDKELEDMKVAVADIRRWNFHEDEAWIRDLLVQLVRGEKSYDDLPCS